MKHAKRRAWRFVMLMAFAFVASACQPELRIQLIEKDAKLPNPGFALGEAENPEQAPRFDTVLVYDGDQTLLWHIRAEPFGYGHGIREVRYGVVPAGFTTVVGPQALKTNAQYTFVAAGRPHGQIRFEVDADGNVK